MFIDTRAGRLYLLKEEGWIEKQSFDENYGYAIFVRGNRVATGKHGDTEIELYEEMVEFYGKERWVYTHYYWNGLWPSWHLETEYETSSNFYEDDPVPVTPAARWEAPDPEDPWEEANE